MKQFATREDVDVPCGCAYFTSDFTSPYVCGRCCSFVLALGEVLTLTRSDECCVGVWECRMLGDSGSLATRVSATR